MDFGLAWPTPVGLTEGSPDPAVVASIRQRRQPFQISRIFPPGLCSKVQALGESGTILGRFVALAGSLLWLEAAATATSAEDSPAWNLHRRRCS